MSTFLTGRDGSLWFGTSPGTKIGKVGSWSLDSQVQEIDVTSLSDWANEYTVGLKSATGTATIWYYDDEPNSFLERVIKTGKPDDAQDIVTLKLEFSAQHIEFTCIITQADLACRVGEIMQANITFQVTDDMTDVVLGET